MSVSRFIGLLPFIVFTALSSYACDDGNVTRIGPTNLDANARFTNTAIGVRPLEIRPIPVSGALCPLVPPLLAPVDLVIGGDRTTGVRLRQVQMQFVDVAGTIGGFRSIGDGELATMLGSTFLPTLGTFTLPLTLPFGCTGGPIGTLGVVVTTADTSGRERRNSFQLPVR